MSGITRHDFGKIRKAAHDLAHNEQEMLKRINLLESDLALNDHGARNRLDALEEWATAFTHRTLWQRLRWLLLGR